MKKLTVEDLPFGYNYGAVDSDGTAYAFRIEPFIHSEKWVNHEDIVSWDFMKIGDNFDYNYWKNSLVKRNEIPTEQANNQTSSPKLKKLKVDDIPEGYNYAAVSTSGVAYVYENEPTINENIKHWSPNGRYEVIGNGYDVTDWRNSLVCREPKKLKTLTVDDIPDGFYYAAIDGNGDAIAYEKEPYLHSTTEWWCKDTDDTNNILIGKGYDSTSWRNSLVKKAKVLKITDIPQGYNYAAVDSCGTAFAYKVKPVIHNTGDYWTSDVENSVEIEGYYDYSDWRNSLVCKDKKSLTESNYRTIEENNAIVNNLTSAHYQCQQPTTNMKLRTLTSENIPQGYYWAAVEPDGVAYAFKEIPKLSVDYDTWEHEEGSDFIKLGKGFDASNWKTSLISFDKNFKVFFENPTVDDIPKGYNYIAVDSFGSVYAYIIKPLMNYDYWVKKGEEMYKQIGVQVGDFDWKNSLVSRPYNGEFKTLTVDDIPEGFNYAAVDFNSWAFAYVNKPSLDKNGEFWKVYDNRGKLSSLCLGLDYDTTDYKNSLVSKTKKTNPKKLTVEDIPEGFNYATVDKNGVARAFTTKPKITLDGDYWETLKICGYAKEIGKDYDVTDWQNSLVSKEEIVRNGIISEEVDYNKINSDSNGVVSSFDYSKFNSISFFDYGKLNSNFFPHDNTNTNYNKIGDFITGISNSSNKTSSFDFTFIKVAEVIAERSKSTRLKVGAVLVKDNRIISTGYNGLVSGVQPDVLEDENGVTKKEVIHAELNCIISCARNGVSCEGSTLYLTHSPCQSCAALIAQSGIKRVIFKNDYRDSIGVNKLGEYGVKVIKLN